MNELEAIVSRLVCAADRHGALATLVRVQGSSYRRPGARLLWLDDGSRIGSISGGCLEEDLLERLKRVAATRESEVAIYDTTSENDLVWGVGLGCHGVVTVLIEPILGIPPWAIRVAENIKTRTATSLAVDFADGNVQATRLSDGAEPVRTYVETVAAPIALVIFGAGDDAVPLAGIAASLGWHVTVADPRPAYATVDRFPMARAVYAGPVESLVQSVRFDARTVAVIMTHHYVHDRPLLRAVLAQSAPFVGLLGPRQRAERILADLNAEGFEITQQMRERLHAPVGLDLGADGARQVALSIVAEIQASLNGRPGTALRERELPIHA